MKLAQIIFIGSLVFSNLGFAQSTTKANAKSKSKGSQIKIQKVDSASASATTSSNTLKPSGFAARPMVNASLSEYAFQPAAGYHAVTARTTYVSKSHNFDIQKDNYNSKNNFQDTRGFLLMARYDHGLQNGWALAGEIGTTLTSLDISEKGQKSDTHSKGFTDVAVTARHNSEINLGQLTYGGTVTISPNESQLPSSREDGNLQTGGNSLAGFVGLQKQQKSYVVGGQLKHQIYSDRSASGKYGNGSKISLSTTGGNIYEVEGFMEVPRQQQLFGAKASLTHKLPENYSYKYNSGGRLDLATEAYNVAGVGVYGKFTLRSIETLELIPQLTYHKMLESSSGTMAISGSSEESEVSLNARISL